MLACACGGVGEVALLALLLKVGGALLATCGAAWATLRGWGRVWRRKK